MLHQTGQTTLTGFNPTSVSQTSLRKTKIKRGKIIIPLGSLSQLTVVSAAVIFFPPHTPATDLYFSKFSSFPDNVATRRWFEQSPHSLNMCLCCVIELHRLFSLKLNRPNILFHNSAIISSEVSGGVVWFRGGGAPPIENTAGHFEMRSVSNILGCVKFQFTT